MFRGGWRGSAQLGAAALVLMGAAALLYHESRKYSGAIAQSGQTRAAEEAVDQLVVSLANAESAERGFLLTGEDRYLEPYNKALETIPTQLTRLDGLLQTHPGEAANVARLDTLVNEKLNEMQKTIALRRSQGPQGALAMVLTGEGRRTMDNIREVSAEIRQGENSAQVRILVEREAAAQVALVATVAVSIVLLFLFAFGLAPFASTEPEAKERSAFVRYGVAVVIVGVTVLFRMALTPLVGPTTIPFTFFFPAIWFAAWFAGLRPGMVAVALSAMVGSYFFAEPTHTLLVGRRDDQIAVLILVLVGFGMALLSESQHRAVAQAEAAQSAERHERQRFETTLGSIGDAVIATDRAGCVTFANKIALSLLKATEAEVLGRPLEKVFRIVNELTRAPVESPVARVLHEGQIVGLANHTVLIAQDGTETPISDSAAPIHGKSGAVVGTVLVFRDVTARRRAEATSRLLAAVVESSDDAVMTVDLNGVITSWNKGAERIFGYTEEEMMAKPLATLAVPDGVDEMPDIMERISRGERVEHYRTLRRTKAGKFIHASVTYSPILDATGRIMGASKILRDVTAQVEAEEMLAAQAAELRQRAHLMERIPCFVRDLEDRIVLWNPGATELYGFSAEEAVGQISHALLKTVFPASLSDILAQLKAEGHWDGELIHTRRNGQTSTVASHWALHRDESGQPVAILEVNADITDRKRAEEARRQSELFAERVLQSITDGFVALDQEWRFTHINAEAERLNGIPREKLLGQNLWELFGPMVGTEVESALRRAAAEGEPVQFDHYFQEIDRWFHVKAYPTQEGGVSIFYQDITARKRAEEDLRRRAEEIQALVDATPALVWIAHDSECQWITGNQAANKLMGVALGTNVSPTPGEGEPFPVRHFRLDGTEMLPRELPMQIVAASGTAVSDFEYEFALPGGRRFRVFGNAAPLFDAAGKVRGAVGTFLDITDRMRAEDARRQSELAAELLRAHDEERRRIGRDLHDTAGQNLVLLKMRLDILAASDELQLAARQKLAESVRLADEAIKQVRTTSYALYPPMLEEEGLKSAIPHYLEGFMERSGIRTHFESVNHFERPPRQVELAVFHVLQESLTNVVRHSGSPAVEVRVDMQDGKLCLEVRDQGKGIPPQILEAYNGGAFSKLGVGLRGMKERIRQLGGRLDISSSSQGTMVRAEVPRSKRS